MRVYTFSICMGEGAEFAFPSKRSLLKDGVIGEWLCAGNEARVIPTRVGFGEKYNPKIFVQLSKEAPEGRQHVLYEYSPENAPQIPKP